MKTGHASHVFPWELESHFSLFSPFFVITDLISCHYSLFSCQLPGERIRLAQVSRHHATLPGAGVGGAQRDSAGNSECDWAEVPVCLVKDYFCFWNFGVDIYFVFFSNVLPRLKYFLKTRLIHLTSILVFL